MISGLENQIRGYINRARTQYVLLQNAQSWNQLCSSLDVIGDTELCFEAYDQSPSPSGDGATYLLVYGALQALVLQQDAVRHMAEALKIVFVPDPNFISRISMTKSWLSAHDGLPRSWPRRIYLGGHSRSSLEATGHSSAQS